MSFPSILPNIILCDIANIYSVSIVFCKNNESNELQWIILLPRDIFVGKSNGEKPHLSHSHVSITHHQQKKQQPETKKNSPFRREFCWLYPKFHCLCLHTRWWLNKSKENPIVVTTQTLHSDMKPAICWALLFIGLTIWSEWTECYIHQTRPLVSFYPVYCYSNRLLYQTKAQAHTISQLSPRVLQ